MAYCHRRTYFNESVFALSFKENLTVFNKQKD